MCDVLLGHVIVECWTYWQESSEIVERIVMGDILLGNAIVKC